MTYLPAFGPWPLGGGGGGLEDLTKEVGHYIQILVILETGLQGVWCNGLTRDALYVRAGCFVQGGRAFCTAGRMLCTGGQDVWRWLSREIFHTTCCG